MREGVPVFVVKFYPPMEDHRDERKMWEMGTKGVPVPVDSESGRRIRWILKNAERPRELGESIFGRNDPLDLHRVRVALSWTGPEEDRRIVLRDLLAANWFGTGFEEDFRSLTREVDESERGGREEEGEAEPAGEGEESDDAAPGGEESESEEERPDGGLA